MADLAYVFTLGFHDSHVVRTLMATGGRRGQVILYTVKPVVRAVETVYKSISGLLDRIGWSPPRLVELRVGDPAASIAEVLDSLESYNTVLADLTGGMRALVVYVYTGLLLHAARGAKVEVKLASEGETAEEATLKASTIVTLIKGGMSSTRTRIAEELLRAGEATAAEIAYALGLTERTVAQHLAWLRNNDFAVERAGTYKPTPWLKIYYKLHEKKKQK